MSNWIDFKRSKLTHSTNDLFLVLDVSRQGEVSHSIFMCFYIMACNMIDEFTSVVNANTPKIPSKTFQCPHCHYAASQKGRLDMHVQSVHNTIKPFKCILCEYVSSRKDFLDRHFKSVHNKNRSHFCERCEYTAITKEQFNRHIKSVHEKVKYYTCPHCSDH